MSYSNGLAKVIQRALDENSAQHPDLRGLNIIDYTTPIGTAYYFVTPYTLEIAPGYFFKCLKDNPRWVSMYFCRGGTWRMWEGATARKGYEGIVSQVLETLNRDTATQRAVGVAPNI